jgi:protein subunit release factor A
VSDLIPPDDLLWEVLRDKRGGQQVGTSSGLRCTHIPTGITVTIDVGRSQFRNRILAIEMLEAALTSPHFR